MWRFQLLARAAVSALVALVMTFAISILGSAGPSLVRLYSDLLPAAVAILGVLVTALAVLAGLNSLRRDAATAASFRQTLSSFRWTSEYAAFLCLCLVVGRNIRLTPSNWAEPAVFVVLFGFVFLLMLLAGLVRAVADAMER